MLVERSLGANLRRAESRQISQANEATTYDGPILK